MGEKEIARQAPVEKPAVPGLRIRKEEAIPVVETHFQMTETTKRRSVTSVKLKDVGLFIKYGPSSPKCSHAFVSDGVVVPEGTPIFDKTIIYPRVKIGNGVRIGKNVLIYSNVTIGDGVKIYDEAVVMESVKIGKDSVIDVGMVVTSDVKENSMVGGGNNADLILLSLGESPKKANIRPAYFQ